MPCNYLQITLGDDKMNEYTITIGERGNEIGHAEVNQYASDADAIKAAKKAVAPYNGDGWFKVTCQGQTVAKLEV